MAKVVTIFVRRADMSRQEFRDYYENHHLAMALPANRHFGFVKYVRNHVVEAFESSPALRDFDAFTEFSFQDMQKALGAQAFMATPEGKALADDEHNFLDMGFHPSFSVEESLIAGAPRGVDVSVTRKRVIVLKRYPTLSDVQCRDRIRDFAEAYAKRHDGEFVRLTFDEAQKSPAGLPPFDAILTLWPADGGDLKSFRWSGDDFSTSIFDVEAIETPPEVLQSFSE